MDIDKVLLQLREELSNIDTAILSLERLQNSRRRGRPPAWLREGKLPPKKVIRKRLLKKNNGSVDRDR